MNDNTTAREIIPEPEPFPQYTKPEPEAELIQHYQPEPEPIPQYEPQPQSEPESEPEPPSRKRRVHWIVPVAISVIIILSLIFYFRNFYHKEDRSQKTEVDRRQLTVDSQRPVPTAQPEGTASDSSQQSAVSGQRPVPSPPKAEEGTASEIVITEGKCLFQLAREVYGNPYLWVLIYKENQDKIPDPDMLISGRELIIPKLEGMAEKLTKKDSLAASEGYRLLYDYFKAKDDPRTNDFFKAMKRYKPL